MNRLTQVLVFFLSINNCIAQLTVDANVTAATMASTISGQGVQISNVTMNCNNGQYGTFDGSSSNVGINQGVLLTTGLVDNSVCIYQLEMQDGGSNGWGCGSMNVYIDGTLTGTYTENSAWGFTTINIAASAGQTISVEYVTTAPGAGCNEGQNSFTIYDPDFNIVASGTGPLTPGVVWNGTANCVPGAGFNYGATGPNDINLASFTWGVSVTDPDLTALEPQAINDVCMMEFDIVPICDLLEINYVFASEEYPDYVCSNYNDAFGFFISGPGIAGTQNMATVPGSADYVAINTINGGAPGASAGGGNCSNPGESLTYTQYFIDNGNGNNCPGQPWCNDATGIRYNGMTVPLTAYASVTPCQTYHMKIIIADAGDGGFDSGVFLTYQGLTCPNTDIQLAGVVTAMQEGCQDGNFDIIRGGDLTQSLTVNFILNGTASSGLDYSMPASVNFATNQTNANVDVNALTDALVEGTESIEIVASWDVCGVTQYDTLQMTISDGITLSLDPTDASCSDPASGAIDATVSGGDGNYSYNWSSGQSVQDISNLTAGVYTLTVNDGTGCSAIETVTITGAGSVTVTAGADGPFCLDVDASGTAHSFSFNSTGSSPAPGGGVTYTWEWDDATANGSGASPTHTYTAAGTYDVTLTISNGSCSDQDVVQVQVFDMPTLNLAPTDVTCNGLDDGIVVATGGAGTPAYSYTWDGPGGFAATPPNSGGSDTETGLAPGTYNVTLSDGNGCLVSATADITEEPTLTLNMSGNDASCNGANDGDATATAGGGTPGYTYLWDDAGFSTTSALSNLTANTYNVTVTDAAGCTITDNQLVDEPAAMTLTPSANDANCGNSDGDASVVATGGAGGYQYLWNDPTNQNTAAANNLFAGAYTVTVTDANSCTITANANVNDAGAPTLNIINAADATCDGFSDGTAEADVTGGTPGYNYAWSNGENTAVAVALPEGVHSVTITDSAVPACVATASVTITDSPALNAAMGPTTDPLCNGDANGTASVNVSGGTTNYAYLWNNGENTNPATGLSDGAISVTVTDAQGCTITANDNLTEPTALTVTVVATDADCDGASDGSADGTVSGGTPAYSYAWSNGATTEDITGIPVGAFTLNVTDANGCTANANDNVNEPAAVSVTLNCTNATTVGGSEGTSTATGGGGTPGYTYNWDVSATTTNSVTGLPAGTVNVTATDANGCTATTSCVITAPNCSVTGSTTVTNTLCLGSSDGTATATMNTGGTPPYNYTWDAAANNQNTQTATGLAAGSYDCVIVDANTCAVTVTAVVGSPAAMVVTATNADPQCIGGSSGSATAGVVSGGTPAYNYAWSNSSNAQTATGLAAGGYTVTVTDVNNCVGTASITLTEPTALNPSIVGTNVSCFGANDGDATISVTGGTSPYNYQWDDPSFSTSPTVTGIGNDTLHVTITDFNGCTAIDSIKITEPALITATTGATNSTCGQSDGSASVTAQGNGVAPYTYQWGANTGNQTTQTANNIPSGSYDVVITDNNGCSITMTQAVNDASGPIATASTDANVICNGGTDGAASVTATGGSTPYTYAWSGGGGANASATGLTSGNYSVTVTDATGCASTDATSISEPTALNSSIIGTTDPSCFGDSDGTANAGVSGGTGPYSYLWSNGAVTNPASGFADGAVSVTVTDAVGCTITANDAVTEPAQLVVNLVPTDVSCNGLSDGAIDATIGGGTTNYSFLWSNGSNAEDLNGVPANNYSITVTDANGCTVTDNDVVNEPTALSASITGTTDVLCNGDNSGNATVGASGGTSPYNYLWTPTGQTNPTAVNLLAGTYSVSVSDANGCSMNVPVTITEPTALSLTLNATDPSCFGANDGSVTSNASGGGTSYNYVWSNTGVTADITGLAGGNYTLTVTDNNGCSITATEALTEPTQLVINSSSNQSSCGQSDGDVTVFVTQGDPAYSFEWSDPQGQTTANATGLYAGNYTVTVTDGNGCTANLTQGVTDAGAPTANILTQTDVSCNGGSDGFAQVTVAGGTMPYSYVWNDPSGQTTASATGLPQGTWSATITDGTGCIAATGVTISEPTQVTAIISNATDVTCFGYTDGTATALGSGGTTPYSYVWNNGQSAQTATGLSPVSYVGVVTDANNCATNVSVTIGEPLQMTLSTTPTDAFCNTPSGQVCVSATNGTAPLSYNWNNGQTNACAGSLIPGNYDVTVTDINGCVATITDVVGNIAPGTASIAGTTDVSCNGGNDGAATVSMGGGATPYTYLWDATAGFQTNTTATGLGQGSYDVSVTDNNGCVVSTSTVINEPSSLTITTWETDASCFQEPSGSGYASGTGGTPSYTYQWDNVLLSQTPTLTGLLAGLYHVTITDVAGCVAVDSIVIDQPTEIQMDSIITNSNCNQNDGSACISVTGGTSTFNYYWENGSTGTCITGQNSGSYQVTVTDGGSCPQVMTAIISDISGPSATIISVTDIDCYGGSNGFAIVNVTGGSGSFLYDWTNTANTTVSTTSILSGVPQGCYSVDVTDGNTGCLVSESICLSEPAQLQLNASSENPSCFGLVDGESLVVVGGGVTPYAYSWVGGPATPLYGNLGAGFYSVDVTDANGCQISHSYTLTDPLEITASVSVTDVSCNGGNDGIATVYPVNGVGGYTYNWDPSSQTSQTAFGLTANNYAVTITDNNGCSIVENNIQITEPDAMNAFINNYGDVSCYGGNDGFAQVQVFGGTLPYTYFWSTGISNADLATGLSANTWQVNVTDANGCTTSSSQVISQPTQLNAAIINSNDVTCNGYCDGDATVSASGGTTPYFYQWNACGLFQTTSFADNLCGDCGISEVTVTDNSGCTTTATVNITEPTALTVTSSSVEPHCGFSDGAITLNINGGTNPYVPTWPAPISQTTLTVDSLAAGVYNITVLDANACFYVEPVVLNDITGPTINYLNHTDASCFGSSDGVINTNVFGGTTPYASITWDATPAVGGGNPYSTGAVGIVFLPGDVTYCETVVDAAGCQASFCQYVDEPTEVISAIVNSNDVSCFGGNDGDATVMAGGGTGAQSDFTYMWTPTSQITPTATGLSAGTYAVESFDLNGCSSTSIVTISEPPQLVASTVVDDATCFGESNGCVTVNTTGGTGFYLYNWNPAGTGSQACGLPAGNYDITVTDQNNCATTTSGTVNQPAQLTASIMSTDAYCTDFNGTATIFGVSGGTPSYLYSWNGMTATTPVVTGLYTNTYTGNVTDGNGCSISLSVTVGDAPAPVISGITFVDPLCNSNCNGSATVNLTGGTSPLTYHWNDIAQQGSQTAVGLCAGSYNVTVTDNNGCVATDGGALVEPAALIVDLTADDYQLCDGECATIFASPSGGVPPLTGYAIVWDTLGTGFTTTVCPDPSTILNANVTVTDDNGCMATDNVVITTGSPLLVSMPDTVETCLGNPVAICADGFGGTAIADYQWNWAPGGGTCNGSATCCQQVQPTDTTTYVVTLEDGCSTPGMGTIVVVVNPVPSISYGVLENEGCPPFVAYFNGSSSMDNSMIEWDLDGDGIVDHTENGVMVGEMSNPVFTYEESGQYTVVVTATSDKQCTTTEAIQNFINIYPRPVASFSTDPESTTLINPQVDVNASASLGVDSLFSWDFNDPYNTDPTYGMNATHFYSDTGTYTIVLDVVNTYGCHDYDSLPFTVEPDFALYAPNAFTPDDDGLNDGFKVYGVGVDPDNFILQIYDRWGEKIFETTEFDKEWIGDSRNNGKLVPNDVYIWKAFVKQIGDSDKTEPKEFIGSVTVVR